MVQEKDRVKGGLSIRENVDKVPYVDGAEKKPVSSWAQLEALQETGNKNRTLGQTLMNATSSRAHTVN